MHFVARKCVVLLAELCAVYFTIYRILTNLEKLDVDGKYLFNIANITTIRADLKQLRFGKVPRTSATHLPKFTWKNHL